MKRSRGTHQFFKPPAREVEEEKEQQHESDEQAETVKECDEKTRRRLELETLKGVVKKAKLEIEKEAEKRAQKEYATFKPKDVTTEAKKTEKLEKLRLAGEIEKEREKTFKRLPSTSKFKDLYTEAGISTATLERSDLSGEGTSSGIRKSIVKDIRVTYQRPHTKYDILRLENTGMQYQFPKVCKRVSNVEETIRMDTLQAKKQSPRKQAQPIKLTTKAADMSIYKIKSSSTKQEITKTKPEEPITLSPKPGPSGLQSRRNISHHTTMETTPEKRYKTDEEKLMESRYHHGSFEIVQRRDRPKRISESNFQENSKLSEMYRKERLIETIVEVEEKYEEVVTVTEPVQSREIGVNTEGVFRVKVPKKDVTVESNSSHFCETLPANVASSADSGRQSRKVDAALDPHEITSEGSLPYYLADDVLRELKSVHSISDDQIREICKLAGYNLSESVFRSKVTRDYRDVPSPPLVSAKATVETMASSAGEYETGSETYMETTEFDVHAPPPGLRVLRVSESQQATDSETREPEFYSAIDLTPAQPQRVESEQLHEEVVEEPVHSPEQKVEEDEVEIHEMFDAPTTYKGTVWEVLKKIITFPFRRSLVFLPAMEEKSTGGSQGGTPKLAEPKATAPKANENIDTISLASDDLGQESKDDEEDKAKARKKSSLARVRESLHNIKISISVVAEKLLQLGPHSTLTYGSKNKATQTGNYVVDDEVLLPDGTRAGSWKDEEPLEERRRAITGTFSDGRKRIDLVLVLPKQASSPEVEEIKMEFFLGLVKTGIQIEIAAGTLKQHRHLQFVKLHATHALLNAYAGPFGVRKYFRDSHEHMVYYNPANVTDILFRHRYEREYLRLLRKRYRKPLRLTPLDRSYIVYMLLRHKTFGKPENYYGLERLLKNGIVLDAYALHDGPAQPSNRPNAVFNNRQMLYLNWFRFPNVFKDQPAHLLYEYYGAKVSFYFIFYEFYNKALFIASLWGIFMTAMYLIKDKDYHRQLRDFVCTKSRTRDMEFMRKHNEPTPDHYGNVISWRTLQCAECEGASDPMVCPYSLIEDYCLDLQIMMFVDNPYIIIYSMGMSFLGLIFLVMWHRTESYWQWMWEETSHPRPAPTRGESVLSSFEQPEPGSIIPPNLVPALKQRLKVALIYGTVHIVLPFFMVSLILAVIFIAFVGVHHWIRPLSLTEFKSTLSPPVHVVPPVINRHLEYFLFMLLVVFVLLLFYVAEMFYHSVAYKLTVWENHWLHHHFEKALVQKYFAFSMIYTVCVVVYFAWIKDAFYFSPVQGWDLVFNISTHTYNFSRALPDSLTTLFRRALTMNCGPFSCFRQASVVFLLAITVRIFIVGTLDWIGRRVHMASLKMFANRRRLPVFEHDYRLRPIDEDKIAYDTNTLMLQFAFVFMFAPLFPLAPLLPLAVNIWDIRTKAQYYILHGRRPVLFKTPGLGAWDGVLAAVCYMLPLIHALTIVRTEVFKRYTWHFYNDQRTNMVYKQTPVTAYNPNNLWQLRNRSAWEIEEHYINFLLFYNFNITKVAENHPSFAAMNARRVHMRAGDNNVAYAVELASEALLENMMYCRVDGFFENLARKTGDLWPYQWSYLEDNKSMNTPEPWHYRVKMYKVNFVLIYLFLFLVISLLIHRYVGHASAGVTRRRLRERALRRLHAYELRFVRAPAAAPAAYRPPPAHEHTAPLAQAGLVAGRLQK